MKLTAERILFIYLSFSLVIGYFLVPTPACLKCGSIKIYFEYFWDSEWVKC